MDEYIPSDSTFSSSSSSSSSSDDNDEEPVLIQNKLNWKCRNQYVTTQLDLMSQLANIASSIPSHDPYFRLKISCKIQNMYRQIEPLLECEDTNTIFHKAYIEEDPKEKKTTISKRIRENDNDPDNYDLKYIGTNSSKKYRKIYGRAPRKTVRLIDQEYRLVNQYTKTSAKYTIDKVLNKINN